MRATKTLAFVMIATALAVTGCTNGETEPTTDVATDQTPITDVVADTVMPSGAPGGIKVVVGLEGTPPEAKKLDRKADPSCAKNEKLDPSVMVSNGKLQNVLVKIVGEVKAEGTAPAAPLEINETDCMFEPRVSTARAGQKLEIANTDQTMYMVEAYRGEEKKIWFNTAQLPGAPAIKKDLEAGVVQLKCRNHPWMAAFVSVTDHPFNSVTGADGTVSWAMVPSGSQPYKVETWHEVFGKQELEVVVEAGKVAEVVVTYKVNGEK